MKTVLACAVLGMAAQHAMGCLSMYRWCVTTPSTQQVVIRPGIEVPPPNHHGWKDWRYQVVVGNMMPGDSVSAFTSSTVGVSGSGTGRLIPFAAPSMDIGSPSGPLTIFSELGGTQRRIAGANCVTMGTNLDWGIRTGQLPRALAGASYDESLTPPFFQFEVVIGTAPGPRDITISIPMASVLEGGATYYKNDSGTDVGFMPLSPANFPTLIIHVLACRSDFNSDDGVDFFDYLDFVDEFSMGTTNADYNQDGIVDFADYLDFVGQFSTGC